MTDTKIKAQGAKGDDAIAPQVQINATTNEWEISTDGGKNWKSTGIKATGEKGDRGDAVFAENGVDYTSDPDNVIFTLADGKTKLTVPRIIRKSKFPQNPKRSVRFSGKRTKRSVQKRKARNTQKAETKVL